MCLGNCSSHNDCHGRQHLLTLTISYGAESASCIIASGVDANCASDLIHFHYRFVISSGDVYNFHFVKTERVASIRDCGGSRFSIPLNSAIEFGALYNPR